MPSKSAKQARLMAAVAHNPKFAKKVGIPQSVGREFNKADRGRRFADGGAVLPSSKDDEESWSDTYIKRPLSGLASMWGGTDPETGEFVSPAWHNLKRAWGADERRRRGLPPQGRASLGIVDETVSLPALGGIIGLPVPEFAEEAEERAGATREAARQSMGLDAPHGFIENIAESAGVMAGQLPVPASVANKLKLLKTSGRLGKTGKILGPAAEWFSPTVVPKAGNYIKGTLFGGVLGGGLDYLEDYLDEEQQAAQQKEWIAEAMAEVLAEEQGESEDNDDAALAELGYAEGGRVGVAKRAISALKEAAPDDPVQRKASLDLALRALSTSGVSLPKSTRDQLVVRSEDETGLSKLLQNIGDLDLIKPAAVKESDPASLIRGGPPPARPVSADLAGRGNLTQEDFNRLVLKKYHSQGAQPELAREISLLDQEDQDWDKLFGYAEGGQVGAPLSQSWYETYGQGPEHLFMGDRKLALPGGWSPTRQSTATTPRPSGGGSSTFSNLAGLATLGMLGYDIYKDHFKDPDLPQNVEYPPDTASTNEWIDRDLADMEMPTAEFDPSVWDRTQQGAGGALDMYIGSQQGGIGGAGQALSGTGDVYEALAGKNQFSGAAGEVGGILQGVGDGTVEGYLQAGGDAVGLAKRMGYTGPVFDKAGKLLPVVGDLFSAYEGIKSGNPAGYAQAAGSLYGAASTAGLAPTTGVLASSGIGTAAPLAALGFAAAGAANQALGVGKKGAALGAYLESLGARRATVKEARNKPGGYKAGYYVMPDGNVVSNQQLKDMYVEAGSPYGDYV